MARIRTVKPDFWRDEDLSSVSPEAALLAIGLLNIADDEGYFKANPKLVEADIFPLRELSGTTTGMIKELENIGYIELFLGSDNKKYGYVISFSKHQVISKAKPSEIKDLRCVSDDSSTDTGTVLGGKEGKGREKEEEGKGMECQLPAQKKTSTRKTSFSKPSESDVIAYEAEKQINLKGFFNYYESNGWMVGRTKMKDWHAAARGWHSRQGTYQARQPNNQPRSEIVRTPTPDFLANNPEHQAIDADFTRI